VDGQACVRAFTRKSRHAIDFAGGVYSERGKRHGRGVGGERGLWGGDAQGRRAAGGNLVLLLSVLLIKRLCRACRDDDVSGEEQCPASDDALPIDALIHMLLQYREVGLAGLAAARAHPRC